MEGYRGRWAALAAALLLALGGVGSALAQSAHGHDHKAMGGAGKMARAGLAASAAFDDRGRLWAVSVAGEYVEVRSSTDFGATWSSPVKVNPVAEPVEADGDSRPRIAVGTGGEIYVTWTKPLAKPFTGEIRFSRSVDGGKTFSTPRPVHADRQVITHRFDSMTITRDGRVLVAWVDKRDLVAAGGKAADYAGAAIYYAVSDDRGASFRGDFKAADNSCECCRIALVPQPDGNVLALWRHVFPGSVRDHALATLGVDGKVTGMRRATWDGWTIDACPHHGPSLAVDGQGRLHAVWFSDARQKSGVFYGRLEADRVVGERRVGGATAEHADLAVSGQRVAIAWKEFDGRNSQLRALVSNDGGATFSERELAATADASDQPRLLSYDGKFYVFWNTRREPLRVVSLP